MFNKQNKQHKKKQDEQRELDPRFRQVKRHQVADENEIQKNMY